MTKQQKQVRALIAVGVVVALLVFLNRRAAAQPTQTVSVGKTAMFSASATQSNADRIDQIPKEQVVSGRACK